MDWRLAPGGGGYPGEGLQGGGSSCQVAPPWEGGGRGERRSITYIQTVVIRVLVVSLPEMEVMEEMRTGELGPGSHSAGGGQVLQSVPAEAAQGGCHLVEDRGT